MEFTELIETARSCLNPWELSPFMEAGGVAAALLTKDGNVYTGICIDSACSLGFCAEHAAAAEMIKSQEHILLKAVAVNREGNVIPPCGRCREFLSQLSPKNLATEIMVDNHTTRTLRELLPYDWKAADGWQ